MDLDVERLYDLFKDRQKILNLKEDVKMLEHATWGTKDRKVANEYLDKKLDENVAEIRSAILT